MVRTVMGLIALGALGAMALGEAAWARDYGRVSETDAWVRTYDYGEEEVFVLKGYYGFVTAVFFRSDEEIANISAGDPQAWDIQIAKNNDFIFLKPTLEPAMPTNLTVITDRRVYLFDLRTEEPEPGETPDDLTLKVYFTYPEPAGPNRAEERRLAEEQRRLEEQAREERQRQLDREAELEALRLQREIQEDARRREEAALARQLEQERIQREADARAAAEEAARAAAEAARQRQIDRLNAPSVIFDNTTGDEDAGRPSDAVQPQSLGSDAYLERLENQRSDDLVFLQDAAALAARTLNGGGQTAVRIDRLDQKVLQGSLIMGNLETAIDSSLTGMIRASVAENVWSADASQVIVPRGSRLIGTYQSEVQFGATRVLVAWTRLIRPDGVSVELASGGADGLGRAGIPGIADTHFATRFGTAALVSVIAGGSAVAVGQLDESATRDTGVDIAATANDNFSTLLEPYLNIPTTIHVHQGAQVIVFVARDLDFYVEDI